MKLPLSAAVLVVVVAACSGDKPGVPSNAPLTAEECQVLAARHRDMTVADAPQDRRDGVESIAQEAVAPMVQNCVAGRQFSRRDFDCAQLTVEGSSQSHDCMRTAAAR